MLPTSSDGLDFGGPPGGGSGSFTSDPDDVPSTQDPHPDDPGPDPPMEDNIVQDPPEEDDGVGVSGHEGQPDENP
jgi:hypothetical protein